MRRREYKEQNVVRMTHDGVEVLRLLKLHEEEGRLIITIIDLPDYESMQFEPTKAQAQAIARACTEYGGGWMSRLLERCLKRERKK